MKTELKNRTELNLNTKVAKLYSVGEIYLKRLEKLGIKRVKDLILYFPFRYEDLSQVKPIIEAQPGKKGTFKGIVSAVNWRRSKKGFHINEVIIQDDSSSIKLIFFNQPYLNKVLKNGQAIVVAGELSYKPFWGKHITNPVFDLTLDKNSLHLGRIVPIYSETKGVTSKWLRSRIKPILYLAEKITDYLPFEVREKQDLINLSEAIKQIHFPEYKDSLKEAIKRLAFDELFLIALRNQIQRQKFIRKRAPVLNFNKNKIKKFVKFLPFKLTEAQRKAAWEILKAITKKDENNTIKPMNRLLNGDVGSGKTVVAAISAYQTYLNNLQVALMAPTEVLAYQHYQIFCKLFGKEVKIQLLTNSYNLSNFKVKPGRKIEAEIIIGTHSLIQEKIAFRCLGLAIIDEQHRFGVKQRAILRRKNQNKLSPHFLSMSATPIPRSLALSLYGDLDISIIDEMPKGRKEIKTYVIPPRKKTNLYQFIKKEIKKGRQAFFICPLIEKKIKENIQKFDFDNRKAAIEEKEKLSKNIFPDQKIGLLHGKMKADDKEKIMRDFKDNKINILVSTSVVEVGVDIPNATTMVIEGAERFGLSQLHQLRGRVGRGEHQSYCFLSTQSWGEKTKQRLQIIKSTTDGFKIAEADLKLRGPGEIYGTKQHGLANLRFASLADIQMIKKVKKEAKDIIRKDPTLKSWPHLKKKVKSLEKEIYLD